MNEALPTTAPRPMERAERAEYLTDVLKRMGAEKALDTPEHSQKFLKGMSYEDFTKWLRFVNDKLRDKPRSHEFDGRSVQVRETNIMDGSDTAEHIPPHADDKEKLLREALARAQGLENVNDAALLIASAITAIHPFNDGNGRTSRLAYTLLAEGYNGTPEADARLHALLGDDGREQVNASSQYLYPFILPAMEKDAGINRDDPTVPSQAWSDLGSEVGVLTPDSLPLSIEVPEEVRSMLVDLIEERNFGLLVFYTFLKSHDMLREPYIEHKNIPGREEKYGLPDEWTTIQVDKVLQDLTEQKLFDLLMIARKMRADAVHRLTDALSNPQKYKFPGKENGVTFSEYLREKAIK